MDRLPDPSVRPADDAASLEDLLADREWVRGLALRLTGDVHLAEDIEQRTWLAALRRPPKSRDASRGWLARVTRNLVHDLWRSDARRAARERSAAAHEALPATDEIAARAEVHRRLMCAVLALREPYQTTVLLRFFDDLSPREIAERTGVPAATVRSRLHRALGELRGRLEADGTAPRAVLLLARPIGTASRAGGSGLVDRLWAGKLRTSNLWGGATVAISKKSLALVAGLLLLVGGGAWVVSGVVGARGDENQAYDVAVSADGTNFPTANEHPADDAAPEPRRRERRVEPVARKSPPADASAAESASVPAEDPVEEPVAQPASESASVAVDEHAAGPERIDVTLRRHLPLEEVPKGYTEVQSTDEIPEILSPKPGERAGPASGPRPLPYWSRWPRPPKKGTVGIEGRVTDASGRPLGGAKVYRIDIGKYADPGDVLSFQYIKEITKTDAAGYFRAVEQLPGEMLIWADYHKQLVAPLGLRVDGALRANPVEHEQLEGIVLKLPIEAARLGAISGRVVDAEGRPAARARVWIARNQVWAQNDGTFRIEGVSPGQPIVNVDHVGHDVARVPVTLDEGKDVTIEIELKIASEGSYHVRGRLVDTSGAPVAGGEVSLGARNYHDARRTVSDAEGRFAFEHLPDRMAKQTVSLSFLSAPGSSRLIGRTHKGLPVPLDDYEMVVQRAVAVTFRHVDRVTEEPLPSFKFDLRSEVTGEDGTPAFAKGGRSGWRWAESGEVTMYIAPGKYLLISRAKDHRAMEVTFEIPATAGAKVVVLAFEPE